MYLFILGTVFGIGLVLAVKSVNRTLLLRQIRKRATLDQLVENRAYEMAKQYSGWDQHETYMVQGTTSGPGPFVSRQHP